MSMVTAAPDVTPCNGQASPNSQTPPSELQARSKRDVGWRRVVRNFTPSWFSVIMGTGIVSILLHNLPYNATAVQYISYVFFGLNVLLFCIFTAITAVRYILYPEIWPAMIAHATQSLFIGCFPMGFATIINMMALCCKGWGDGFIYFTWTLWWIDVWLSLAACISMPFVVTSRHKPNLQSITAAILLPIVPTIVAAASGGIIAEILPNHGHAITTLVVSYILWGIGECFSACVLALYFLRLTIYSLPAKEVIVSVFLPIGPLGQGGFGIQQLGKVALTLIPETKTFGALGIRPTLPGEVLYVTGVFLGMVMWGFGLVWLSFALISIGTTKNIPFNMGWWGFTFPVGVLTSCTGLLAENLDSDFFRVCTMMLSATVVLLWVVVAFRTVYLVKTGEMFYAPCLKDIRKGKGQGGGCSVP